MLITSMITDSKLYKNINVLFAGGGIFCFVYNQLYKFLGKMIAKGRLHVLLPDPSKWWREMKNVVV